MNKSPIVGISALLLAACGANGASSADHPAELEADVTNATVYNYGTLANPGSCLDASGAGTGDGTQLDEWVCNGTGAQSYAAIDLGDGTVNLLNTHANKCVDVYGAGTGNGNKIDLWDCNGTVAQTFVLQPAANGFINIVNPNSGKCLDVAGDNPANGTLVQLYDCNGTNAQLWNPAAIGTVTTGGGSPACGVLTGGQNLGQNQSVTSCDGRFELIMQTDGNLVLYMGSQPLWASGTVGSGYEMSMQTDGNFVVYNAGHAPLWAAGTYGNPGATLDVQDDGNLVVYSAAGKALWASNTAGAGSSSGGPGAGWTLTWSDEFDGPNGSAVDPTKWRYDTGGSGWGNDELEYYTSGTSNAVVENGNLVITAQQAGAGQYSCWYGPCQYTSARLNTSGLFSQQYGYFEARIQIPEGQGVWPAFWMLGENIGSAGWPGCGEIDVMENIGSTPDTVYGTTHGPGPGNYPGEGLSGSDSGGSPFGGGFHVYGTQWGPNEIDFYVDGNLYWKVTPSMLPAGATWVFDQPFFILLNFAVGGSWPGSPNGSTAWPQQMLVDYVRVYAAQ
jgi:beta-glucanase (GH16 family)